MKLFDNNRERIKEEQRIAWKLTHICYECGKISKGVLTAAHPTKAGRVCEKCRKKLWRD